ncbi:unnamed protein product, partial [Adineta ricciae]
GDGTFSQQLNQTVGKYPSKATTADLDNDGYLDVITINYGDNTISVLLGNGNRTFSSQVKYATGVQPSDIAIGDLNKDNKIDVIVTNSQSEKVSVFLNKCSNVTATTS